MHQCELCDQSGVPLVSVGDHVLCFPCEAKTSPGDLPMRLAMQRLTRTFATQRQMREREEESARPAPAAAVTFTQELNFSSQAAPSAATVLSLGCGDWTIRVQPGTVVSIERALWDRDRSTSDAKDGAAYNADS